ncbi:hypothetical protein BGX23_002043 [Mortierella sp. AD031]|nr:hypothetical protein BGX23_002043 [Mortierella sp. AD031]
MDSRGNSQVRPLVIALCIVLILSLVLSCLRRRRAIALRQQQLAQQTQTTELGDIAYVYQYPPPPGIPTPGGAGGGRPLYTPPPGTPMMMSQSPTMGYYSPMVPGGGGVGGMPGQQQSPFPQAQMAYPPMPMPVHQPTGTTSTTSYVPAQDGSANMSNPPLSAADVNDGVPAVPPPPYTPAIPK